MRAFEGAENSSNRIPRSTNRGSSPERGSDGANEMLLVVYCEKIDEEYHAAKSAKRPVPDLPAGTVRLPRPTAPRIVIRRGRMEPTRNLEDNIFATHNKAQVRAAG